MGRPRLYHNEEEKRLADNKKSQRYYQRHKSSVQQRRHLACKKLQKKCTVAIGAFTPSTSPPKATTIENPSSGMKTNICDYNSNYWATRIDHLNVKFHHHVSPSSQEYVDRITRGFIISGDKDVIHREVVSISHFQARVRRYENEILAAEGMQSGYESAAVLEKQITQVLRWLEEILCQAMVDPHEVFCVLQEYSTCYRHLQGRTAKHVQGKEALLHAAAIQITEVRGCFTVMVTITLRCHTRLRHKKRKDLWSRLPRRTSSNCTIPRYITSSISSTCDNLLPRRSSSSSARTLLLEFFNIKPVTYLCLPSFSPPSPPTLHCPPLVFKYSIRTYAMTQLTTPGGSPQPIDLGLNYSSPLEEEQPRYHDEPQVGGGTPYSLRQKIKLTPNATRLTEIAAKRRRDLADVTEMIVDPPPQPDFMRAGASLDHEASVVDMFGPITKEQLAVMMEPAFPSPTPSPAPVSAPAPRRPPVPAPSRAKKEGSVSISTSSLHLTVPKAKSKSSGSRSTVVPSTSSLSASQGPPSTLRTSDSSQSDEPSTHFVIDEHAPPLSSEELSESIKEAFFKKMEFHTIALPPPPPKTDNLVLSPAVPNDDISLPVSDDDETENTAGPISKAHRDILMAAFDQIDDIIKETAEVVGRTQENVLYHWHKARAHTRVAVSPWNQYQRYFCDYATREQTRVGDQSATAKECWPSFKRSVANWQSIIEAHWDLVGASALGATIKGRQKKFKSLGDKVESQMLAAAQSNNFQGIFCLVGGSVNEDGGLGRVYVTPGLEGVLADRLLLNDDVLIGQLRAQAFHLAGQEYSEYLKGARAAEVPSTPAAIKREVIQGGKACNEEDQDVTAKKKEDFPSIKKVQEDVKKVLFEVFKPAIGRQKQLTWAGLSKSLFDTGYILVNWPEGVWFPGETESGMKNTLSQVLKDEVASGRKPRGTTSAAPGETETPKDQELTSGKKSRGLKDLSTPAARLLWLALQNETTLPFLEKCDPDLIREMKVAVMYGTPPLATSKLTHGRRAFIDGRRDRLGLVKGSSNPSFMMTFKGKAKAGASKPAREPVTEVMSSPFYQETPPARVLRSKKARKPSAKVLNSDDRPLHKRSDIEDDISEGERAELEELVDAIEDADDDDMYVDEIDSVFDTDGLRKRKKRATGDDNDNDNLEMIDIDSVISSPLTTPTPTPKPKTPKPQGTSKSTALTHSFPISVSRPPSVTLVSRDEATSHHSKTVTASPSHLPPASQTKPKPRMIRSVDQEYIEKRVATLEMGFTSAVPPKKQKIAEAESLPDHPLTVSLSAPAVPSTPLPASAPAVPSAPLPASAPAVPSAPLPAPQADLSEENAPGSFPFARRSPEAASDVGRDMVSLPPAPPGSSPSHAWAPHDYSVAYAEPPPPGAMHQRMPPANYADFYAQDGYPPYIPHRDPYYGYPGPQAWAPEHSFNGAESMYHGFEHPRSLSRDPSHPPVPAPARAPSREASLPSSRDGSHPPASRAGTHDPTPPPPPHGAPYSQAGPAYGAYRHPAHYPRGMPYGAFPPSAHPGAQHHTMAPYPPNQWHYERYQPWPARNQMQVDSLEDERTANSKPAPVQPKREDAT